MAPDGQSGRGNPGQRCSDRSRDSQLPAPSPQHCCLWRRRGLEGPPKGHLWGFPSQKGSEGGGRLGLRPCTPSTGRPAGGLAWPWELGVWVRVDALASQSCSHPTDSWWAADKERQLSESQLATDKTDKHLQWPEEGGGGPVLGVPTSRVETLRLLILNRTSFPLSLYCHHHHG